MEARRLPIYIPNRLRKHRRLQGYSQRDVARLLGLKNANRIYKWERGSNAPDFLNFMKLAILYRTTPFDLYFELFQEPKGELTAREQELFGSN